MAPGNILAGVGFKWNPKPCFTATLSPATWRGVMVKPEYLRSAYGFDESESDKMLRNEFGGDVTCEYKQDVCKNVNVYTRLQLFSNYLDKPQNVDIFWDVQLVLTVNKWLATNIATNMVYDDDISTKNGGPRLQFKEALSVGLTFNF